jgi:hypothetical protein
VRSFPGGARVSADGRDAGLAVEVEVDVLPEAIAVLI